MCQSRTRAKSLQSSQRPRQAKQKSLLATWANLKKRKMARIAKFLILNQKPLVFRTCSLIRNFQKPTQSNHLNKQTTQGNWVGALV